ncbi:hypothetical protein [uncultured Cohaesibacter sp.]|uniref:hypothetical protein n=1 Tax=uncultured Cohaesibacter sp. TaxID=1002546 RepID=UPI00292FF8DB|nr:hypothetical protein [uncultured Cohaesibacter sp.]
MAKQAIYILPRLPALVLLEILVDLFETSDRDMFDRVHIQCEADGNAVLSLKTKHTRLGVRSDPKVEGVLFDAFNLHEYVATKGWHLPEDLADIRLEDFPEQDLMQALSGLIALSIASSQTRILLETEGSRIAKVTPLEECAYILGALGPFSKAAESFARIEWRSSGMAVSCLDLVKSAPQGAVDEAASLAIARIGLSPEWGGTQDITYKYRDLFESEVDFRLAFPMSGGHHLLLKPSIQLEVPVRYAASAVLNAVLRKLVGEKNTVALALDWQSDDSGFVEIEALQVDLPRLDVIPTVDSKAAQSGGGPVSVQYVEFEHSDDATLNLRQLLQDHAGEIGHRLSLQRLPYYPDSEEVLLEIDQQIDELSIRRDLIVGEGAGDWRLLRFSADNLDAFVDYLRRFRQDVVDSGYLRYGFRSSEHAPMGVHYLLYRLRDVGIEPAYPSAFWQSRIDSGTISHRIDPMFAQFSVANKARSLVFTPQGHAIVPNFRATQGDIDAYLRQGFGGFFDYGAAFVEGEERELDQPIYLFGFTKEDRIRLEIMDASSFQPIKRVVPFLNDNLEIGHHTRIGDFIANVTDAQWRSDRLESLQQKNSAMSETLGQQMAALDRQLAAQSEQLLGAMTEEINALRLYLSKITGLMEDLSDRSVALEELVGESLRNATSYEDMVNKIPGQFSELEQTRRAVQDAIWTEYQNSEAFVQTANKNITAMGQMITKLREELAKDE